MAQLTTLDSDNFVVCRTLSCSTVSTAVRKPFPAVLSVAAQVAPLTCSFTSKSPGAPPYFPLCP